MFNLTGIINKMFTVKGKEQRNQDVALVKSMSCEKVSVIDLVNDPDNAKWHNADFWCVINDRLVEVSSASYTGLVMPNGVAQWEVFTNFAGILCSQGYVFDDTIIYVTHEYKPIKGAWQIYQESKQYA